MSKVGKLVGILGMLAVAIFLAVPAMAQEAAPEAAAAAGQFLSTQSMLALSLAIAACSGAMAQGKAISTAVDGIARNPEASGKIQMNLIVGLAFIESLTIYALLVCFILK
ncbi:ATP synthase F0 subunit C [bacterium]|nr:ATP synthase F0 subunit C [bacterium]